MKLKPIFYSFLLLFTFVNCKDTAQKEFVFNPTTSKQYQFKLTSKNLNYTYEVTCNFKKEKDSIIMSTIIDKMEILGTSEIDKEMNKEYQHFINTTTFSAYNKYGKSLFAEDSPKRILNPEFFVVEFPEKAIKAGDTWSGKKSTNPDFIFSVINTKYTLKKIIDNNNAIAVEMISEVKENTDPTMTKKYVGTYIINNDGTIKSATLKLTGNTGFSVVSGKIEINEI